MVELNLHVTGKAFEYYDTKAYRYSTLESDLVIKHCYFLNRSKLWFLYKFKNELGNDGF